MKPRLMARTCVYPRGFIDRQTVVDVVPIVVRGVGRVDAERLDGVDQLQHPFDLGPTRQPQQDVATGPHVGHGRAALAGRDSPQDIDPRDDRAEVIRGPAHEREYVARRKRQDTPPFIENLLLGGVAEADPVLDALLEPQKFDMGKVAHAIPPSQEDCCAEKLGRCGARVALQLAFMSGSAPIVALRVADRRLSPAVGVPCSVNRRGWKTESTQGFESMCLVPCL